MRWFIGVTFLEKIIRDNLPYRPCDQGESLQPVLASCRSTMKGRSCLNWLSQTAKKPLRPNDSIVRVSDQTSRMIY